MKKGMEGNTAPVSHEERLLLALESIAASWRGIESYAALTAAGALVCATALICIAAVISK